MPVRKMNAAARDLFHLGAAHSSDSETESDAEWERPPDGAFCVDSLFDRSNARNNEMVPPCDTPSLRLALPSPALVHGCILLEGGRGGAGGRRIAVQVCFRAWPRSHARRWAGRTRNTSESLLAPRCAQQVACFCSWPWRV